MKIAIYSISKNEIKSVDRFMNSVVGLPVYVLDHSTDGTSEALRSRGAIVDVTPITPFDFDKGKNAALALVPKSFDFVLNMDLDETLDSKAYSVFDKVSHDTTIVRHLYKSDAKSDRVRHECRLHARSAYSWHLPVHEFLRRNDGVKENIQIIDEVLLTQYPDPNRKHTWCDKLIDSCFRFPNEPRLQLFCGRDLYFENRFDESIEHLMKFIQMEKDNSWDYDVSYAQSLISKCYAKMGRPTLEKNFALMSAQIDRRESVVDLAHIHLKRGEYLECRRECFRALGIKQGEFAGNYDPGAWSFKPFEMLMIADYNLGLFGLAIDHGEKALSMASGMDAKRISENLSIIKSSK